MEIYNDTYCVYIHTNKINGKNMLVKQNMEITQKEKDGSMGTVISVANIFIMQLRNMGGIYSIMKLLHRILLWMKLIILKNC